MKRKLQPISKDLFVYPGIAAFCYEQTAKEIPVLAGEAEADEALEEFHVVFYKDQQELYWLILSPLSQHTVLLRSPYVSEDGDTPLVTPSIISCAEKIARQRGFERLTVNACPSSNEFYELHGFKQTGETFVMDGTLFRRMIKRL